MSLWSDLKNLARNQENPTGRALKEVSDSAARVKENPFSFKTWGGFGARSFLSAASMVLATAPMAIYYGAKHGVKTGIDVAKDHPTLSLLSFGIIPVVAGGVVGIASTAAVAVGGSLAIAGFAASAAVSLAAFVGTGAVAAVGSVGSLFLSEKINRNEKRLNEARAGLEETKDAEKKGVDKDNGKDGVVAESEGRFAKKTYAQRHPRHQGDNPFSQSRSR